MTRARTRLKYIGGERRIIWMRNKENEESKKTWKSGKMMNLKLTIEDMSEDGAGIGKQDGYIWFVKDADRIGSGRGR